MILSLFHPLQHNVPSSNFIFLIHELGNRIVQICSKTSRGSEYTYLVSGSYLVGVSVALNYREEQVPWSLQWPAQREVLVLIANSVHHLGFGRNPLELETRAQLSSQGPGPTDSRVAQRLSFLIVLLGFWLAGQQSPVTWPKVYMISCVLALFLPLLYFITFLETYVSIGDFGVAFRLCFKASPSAKPLILKLVLSTCKWTKICVWRKATRKSPIGRFI